MVNDSNRIAVRLLPCDVLARVAEVAHQAGAELEVEVVRRLAETESPVAALDPRVEPRAYVDDGFVVTFWTYYEPKLRSDVTPLEYAHALTRLHSGMRRIDPPVPHFTDRVAEAQRIVANPDRSPSLGDENRRLLSTTLTRMRWAIGRRGATEQLLHGEPHPGNLMRTKERLLFVDLETCCRGPVEFDVAHTPEEVSERYGELDLDLLGECRILMLAMITAWRWDRYDQLPDGRGRAAKWLSEMRVQLDRYGSG